jgi:hypothetical protein
MKFYFRQQDINKRIINKQSSKFKYKKKYINKQIWSSKFLQNKNKKMYKKHLVKKWFSKNYILMSKIWALWPTNWFCNFWRDYWWEHFAMDLWLWKHFSTPYWKRTSGTLSQSKPGKTSSGFYRHQKIFIEPNEINQ